ncbi:TTC31 protein, partial [Eurystomus gularis]|nr:TTC31 protein [Eurystomus gularis]
ELVAEEERMKRKAEKKKLKKKKQKDRKKQEKLEQEQKNKQEADCHLTPAFCFQSTPAAGSGHPQSSGAEEKGSRSGPGGSSGEEGRGRGTRAEELEDELDLSCTFVSKARQKAGVKLPAPSKEKPARTGNTEPGRRAPGKVPKAKPSDASAVEQSLILAGYGNEAAQQGRYAEAVQAFTKALQLNPQEHRLFGNRSYCLEKLQRYEEALQDALESLRLQPGWPKGFFRKGKALRGLQHYAEAASTFEELLCQERADAEAIAQLQACQALLLQSSCRSSSGGVPVSLSPLEAGEPLMLSSGLRASGSCQDTDTSGFVTVVSSRSQAKGQGRPAAGSPQTLPPTHPARDCYPLWVGNITPRISEKVLQGAFSCFGEIRFIRLLLERRCAFINYARKKAAEAAYAAM